jgi:hypothetical protein
LVNRNREEVSGLRCFTNFANLPEGSTLQEFAQLDAETRWLV